MSLLVCARDPVVGPGLSALHLLEARLLRLLASKPSAHCPCSELLAEVVFGAIIQPPF